MASALTGELRLGDAVPEIMMIAGVVLSKAVGRRP